MTAESPQRIEPARLEQPSEAITDLVAELATASATLGHALNPRTAANLAGLVRIMNTYYSNLIEGHNTRPSDIERARAGNFEGDRQRRNLQVEAAAHVRLQAEIDRMAAENVLPEPASPQFIRWLHGEFYRDAPQEMLRVRSDKREFVMEPGAWRSRSEHDVAVGRHQPPSTRHVETFTAYFGERYRLDSLGKAARILAIPAAHHRFNYIHPFPDGNGRVSRLMSHAMAHRAGIAAHGPTQQIAAVWSSLPRTFLRGLTRTRMRTCRPEDDSNEPDEPAPQKTNSITAEIVEKAYDLATHERHLKLETMIDNRIKNHMGKLVALKSYAETYAEKSIEVLPPPEASPVDPPNPPTPEWDKAMTKFKWPRQTN